MSKRRKSKQRGKSKRIRGEWNEKKEKGELKKDDK